MGRPFELSVPFFKKMTRKRLVPRLFNTSTPPLSLLLYPGLFTALSSTSCKHSFRRTIPQRFRNAALFDPERRRNFDPTDVFSPPSTPPPPTYSYTHPCFCLLALFTTGLQSTQIRHNRNMKFCPADQPIAQLVKKNERTLSKAISSINSPCLISIRQRNEGQFYSTGERRNRPAFYSF